MPDFLQELMTLVIVFTSFIGSNLIQQDSGILTVVLMGIILANQQIVSLQHIKVFKENLRILSISTLFIVLSSRLVFSDITSLLDLKHFLYLLSLIFLVRPIVTFISLIGSSLAIKERLLMAWIAPRGIVTASIASLFALRLVNLGVEDAELLVPLTFLVLIFTVVVYGFSLNPFIRFIRLSENDKTSIIIVGANKVSVGIAMLLNSLESVDVTVVDSNRKRIQYARLDGLKAIHSSVFSSRIMEDMQLGAFQNLVALTENDEVNTLACIQYSEFLGSKNVFRLPPSTINVAQSDALKKVDIGSLISNPTVGFNYLNTIFESNESFRVITIVKDISRDEFDQLYGEDTVPIIGISKSNAILSSNNLETFSADDSWVVIENPSAKS